MDYDKINAEYDKRNERGSKPRRKSKPKSEYLHPLSPKLEKMLEDSWKDNKELYMALKDEGDCPECEGPCQGHEGPPSCQSVDKYMRENGIY